MLRYSYAHCLPCLITVTIFRVDSNSEFRHSVILWHSIPLFPKFLRHHHGTDLIFPYGNTSKSVAWQPMSDNRLHTQLIQLSCTDTVPSPALLSTFFVVTGVTCIFKVRLLCYNYKIYLYKNINVISFSNKLYLRIDFVLITKFCGCVR
jgi:hypothetical protein